ncbi:hypothetical protein HY439_02915 [Candidatus Microgenomates bacterium]|nr:hypothetical protein [Candidatus Microgenomates bacterium]
MEKLKLKLFILCLSFLFLFAFFVAKSPGLILAQNCSITPSAPVSLEQGDYFVLNASGFSSYATVSVGLKKALAISDPYSIFYTTRADGNGLIENRTIRIPTDKPTGIYFLTLEESYNKGCSISEVTVAKAGSIGGGPAGPGFQPATCAGGGIETAIGCIPTSATGFASFFLKYIIGIAGAIALFLFFVAGFQILTSSGNPEKLQGAKQLLTAAVVGLLFLIFAVVILDFFNIKIFGGIPGIPIQLFRPE